MSEVLTSFRVRCPVGGCAFHFRLSTEVKNSVLANFQPLRTERGKAVLVFRAIQRFANREPTGRVIIVTDSFIAEGFFRRSFTVFRSTSLQRIRKFDACMSRLLRQELQAQETASKARLPAKERHVQRKR